jgi:hypothetical protein
MKKNCWKMIMLSSIIGMASCSPVPRPISHQFTTQTKIEAAQHWEVLAQDFAKQTVSSMMADPLWVLQNEKAENMYIEDVKSPDTNMALYSEVPSIYLQTTDLSDFGKSFRSYLITEITKLGYPIAHKPEGAVIARWSVNKIQHHAERMSSAWPGAGTAASLLGYGIYKIIDNSSSDFVGVLAAGIAYDLVNGTQGASVPRYVPHTEIVLTFTVSKDEKILSRQTQAYYVNAADFNHYRNIADYAGQDSQLKPVKFHVTN